MKEKTAKTKDPVLRTNFKHYPITQKHLDYLCKVTGENQSEVIRRSIAYAALQVYERIEELSFPDE